MAIVFFATSDGPRKLTRKQWEKEVVPGKLFRYYVEFDDMGAKQKNQFEALKERLTDLANKGRITVVLFVHGWKNNSETAQQEQFEKFAEGLLGHESNGQKSIPQPIVAVSVCWRGKVFESSSTLINGLLWPMQQLSFWNRMGAAERIGTSPEMTQLLFSITDIVRRAKSGKDSSIVYMGHSFGGLMVERAFAQPLVSHSLDISRASEAAEPRENISKARADREISLWPNLILLINPASDSITTTAICDSLDQTELAKNPDARPFIVSLTSESDRDTQYLFPIGRWCWALLFSVSNRHAENFKVTPGHNSELRNMIIGPQKDVSDAHENISTVIAHNLKVVSSMDNSAPLKRGLITLHVLLAGGSCKAIQIQPQTQFQPESVKRSGAPLYWVLSVPPSIMDGHNDVFSTGALSLYAGIYGLTDKPTEREKKSEPPQTSVVVPAPKTLVEKLLFRLKGSAPLAQTVDGYASWYGVKGNNILHFNASPKTFGADARREVQFALANLGYFVATFDQRQAYDGKSSVRYFRIEDESFARQTAEILSEIAAHYGRSKVFELDFDKKAGRRPYNGQLEVYWGTL